MVHNFQTSPSTTKSPTRLLLVAMASKMIVIVLLMLLAVLSSAQQFMPVWGAPGFGNFMLAGNQADGMYLLCGSVNCGRG
uniref:Secreted protein n=1 Tax=Bursaphelenchus xylophilus TaxID=6326 RepID=A0A1I7RIA9_BURXY